MNKSTALKLLCLTVFILAGMPKLNVKFGPLPLYAIDFMLFMVFIYAMRIPKAYQGRTPLSGFVITIMFFAVLGELAALFRFGQPLQPTYLIVRELLACSLFFSASRIIQTSEDIQAVLKAAVLGVLITALMMIMSSLPPTRGITNFFFAFSFFEPASNEVLRGFALIEHAMRGRSLVGVSILSGAFLNAFWPLVGLLYRWPGIGLNWKYLALAGTLLAPFGIVMGYSRGALIGLAFVVLGLLFFGSGPSRRGVIVAFLFALTVFNAVGWDSDFFFFDRIENRVTAMVEDPYSDPRETERLYAYTEPFEHVLQNPRFLLIGEGVSPRRIEGAFLERSGKSYHALFAAAYYAYGMLASFIYMFMVVAAFVFLWRQIRRLHGSNSMAEVYAQALFASLLGLVPWLLFGHAVVTVTHGMTLMFLFLGFVASLNNFQAKEEYIEGKRR